MWSGLLLTIATVSTIASADPTPVVFDFEDIAVSNTNTCGFKKWNRTEVYQGVQFTNMVYTLNRTETRACTGDDVHPPAYPDGLFPGWGIGGPIGVANGTLTLNSPDLGLSFTGNVSFYMRLELTQEEIDAGDTTQLIEVSASQYGENVIQKYEYQIGIDGNLFEWYHIANTAQYRFLEIRARTWLVDRPETYRDALFYITDISIEKV